MKTLNYITLVLILLFIFKGAAAQNDTISKDNYIIYSVRKGKEVKLKSIVEDLRDFDVLFFGEEHNDSIAHQLQALVLEMMYKKYGESTTLSMEMFDRDVQHIMDEYLSGKIKESYFNKDSRIWKNYEDYKPLVEFAKLNGLKVVCANAPFRYVSIANRGGIDALLGLSDRAKPSMAPLPYKLASGKYAEKLDALMSHGSGSLDTTKTNDTVMLKTLAFDMKPGQSLWDATMAYSVYQYLKEHPDGKVLHLNGRFHTDEYFGIIQRLAEFDPNIKPLVISQVGSDKKYPNVNFDDYKHLGDYIIFTNPNLDKTF